MAKYSYNKAVGKKAAERRQHAEGVFARLVTGVDKYVPEDRDDVCVIVRTQALKDPQDPDSVVPGTDLGDFFTLPIDNPEVSGHSFEEHEWADMHARNWAEFAAAIWPDEVPLRPMRQEENAKGKLVGPYFYQGEEILAEDYADCLEESVNAAGQKAVEIAEALDNDDDLGSGGLGIVGAGFFSAVKRKVDKKGIERTNQVAYRAELPERWAKDFVTGDGLYLESSTANGAAGKPTASKRGKASAKPKSAAARRRKAPGSSTRKSAR